MAEKAVTPKKFVAYAPFSFRRWYEPEATEYKEGDEFVPGKGLTLDSNFDNFRKTGKGKAVKGITFAEVGDVISADPKERKNPNAERYTYHHTLPLKEA